MPPSGARGALTTSRSTKRGNDKRTIAITQSTSIDTACEATTDLRPIKRRKLVPPPKSESTVPQIVPLAHVYDPSLLPPKLSFSLPTAIAHLSAHDSRFRLLFRHLSCTPFQPPYAAIDPFKTLVTSIIGQQVSWMAARAINKRFRALFGYKDEDGFPSPVEVAMGEVLVLKGAGLSTRKAEYGESRLEKSPKQAQEYVVIELARHFLDGRLSTELLRDGTDEEICKALIAVRGIGQVGHLWDSSRHVHRDDSR